MNRMRAVTIGIVASSAFVCAALVTAQQQQTAPPRNDLAGVQAVETSRDSRVIGVAAVRTIETAEVEHKAWHGAYASWDELYRAPDEQKRWERLHLSAGPEIVPGWELRLVASADGKHFELSLSNASDECAVSFFSDERGMIYQGVALGCSAELVPNAK